VVKHSTFVTVVIFGIEMSDHLTSVVDRYRIALFTAERAEIDRAIRGVKIGTFMKLAMPLSYNSKANHLANVIGATC